MCSFYTLIKNQNILKIIYRNLDNMILVFAILYTVCLVFVFVCVFHFRFNSLANNSVIRDPEIDNMICVIIQTVQCLYVLFQNKIYMRGIFQQM